MEKNRASPPASLPDLEIYPGTFIKIKEENKKYFHIYFNNNKEEIKKIKRTNPDADRFEIFMDEEKLKKNIYSISKDNIDIFLNQVDKLEEKPYFFPKFKLS